MTVTDRRGGRGSAPRTWLDAPLAEVPLDVDRERFVELFTSRVTDRDGRISA